MTGLEILRMKPQTRYKTTLDAGKDTVTAAYNDHSGLAHVFHFVYRAHPSR